MNNLSKQAVTPSIQSIPYGYCHCGCGHKTAIADRTSRRDHTIVGEPRLFLSGHNSYKPRPESRTITIENEACRTVPLSDGQEAVVNECDYDAVKRFRWTTADRNKPYAYTRVRTNGRMEKVRMHNFIMGTRAGVDHKNLNKLDNRRSNLRKSNTNQNMWNRNRQRNNSSGYIGVCWRKNRSRWIAQIDMYGRRTRIGSFKSSEDAARAYDDFALKYRGEFAVLNFPAVQR